MKAKILVLDDVVHIVESLEIILKDQGYETIPAYSSEDVFKVLENGPFPDLAILDIKLEGEDLNGIDLANKILEKKKIPLIFSTAYSSIDSYVKRINEEIKDAVILEKTDKYNEQNILNIINLAVEKYFENEDARPLFQLPPTKGKICINPKRNKEVDGDSKNRKIIIDYDDILYVEANGPSVIIKMTNGKKYTLSMTLKKFIEQFEIRNEDSFFQKAHKSYYINFSRIIGFDNGHVFFKEDQRFGIPITKTMYLNLNKHFSPFKC